MSVSKTIWIVCAPCLGLALLVRRLFLPTRQLPTIPPQISIFLRRLPIDHANDRTLSQEDLSNSQPPLPDPLA
jgi:hypothetical protein